MAVLLFTALLILGHALPGLPLAGWAQHLDYDHILLYALVVMLGLASLSLLRAHSIALMHRTVFDYNMDAILLTRSDGRILTANPAACALFGYSRSQLKAGGRQLLTFPGDPEVEALVRKRQEEGSLRGDMWMRHRSGRRIRAEVSSVVFDFRGERRTAMIIRDIGNARQNSYERRIAEAVYQDVNQGVSVFDHAWRMLQVNQALLRMSGYAKDALIGRTSPLRLHLEAEDPDKLAEINAALEQHGHWSGEVNTRRRDGEIYPLFGTLTRIDSPVPGLPHYVATFSDVSSLRDYERKLRDISQHDPITGLPNRILFEETVQQALGRADPGTDTLALMLVDIDEFRNINESLGHEAGDRMLREASLRLIEQTGERALVGRHTGDSFAVLVEGLSDVEEAGLMASAIVDGFQPTFDGPQGPIRMSVGIGLACFPNEGSSVANLLRHAEIALGRAKQAGGDGYRLYEAGAEQEAQYFIALAAEIRKGLEEDAFEAYFQPVLDIQSRRIVSMEALARWPRGSGSPIGPADFIPVAERSGLITPLSQSMLRQSCRHLRNLCETGHAELRVAVNLSARQFADPRMAENMFAILEQEQIAPSSIILEITESLLMDEPDQKRRILEQLQAGGLHVVMDDFGTGYSSLGYLKHFNLDGIKMDRSFIRGLPHASKDAAIVRTILAIGHELQFPVVAEGVEYASQFQFLEENGCRRVQGNLIGPPMSSADFLHFMDRRAQQDLSTISP